MFHGTPLTPINRQSPSHHSSSIFDNDNNDDSNRIINNKNNELIKIYNTRCTQINNILLEICNSIGNDTIIASLLSDNTTTSYIYGHLTEVMTNHLDQERESLLQNTIKKLIYIQSLYTKEQEESSSLRQHLDTITTELHAAIEYKDKYILLVDKYNDLEKSYQDIAIQAQIDTDNLKNNINILTALNNDNTKRNDDNTTIINNAIDSNKKLQVALDESKNKCFLLEKKVLQCNHEILLLKAIEDKEIKLKGELKDNYNKLLLTNDSLNDDKATLTKKLLNNESELIRLNEILNQKVEDDAKNKDNINLLMNQVENLLHKESMESNKVINTINEKNYDKQQKLLIEIEKLKKANTFLQEENLVLSSQRNSKTREIESKSEEELTLKNRLMISENTINNLKNKMQEMSIENNNLRLKNSDLLSAVELSKLRVEEIQKRKDEEIKMIEEKLKFDSKKANDMDRLRDEGFYNSYKFRYMNELGRPMSSLPSPAADPNFNLNASYNVNHNITANTPDPKSAYRTLDTMNTPFTPAVNSSMLGLPAHVGLPTDSSAFSLAHVHMAIDSHKEKAATEKLRLETQLNLDKINYENRIAVLNKLLVEANENIETLKNMLINHREALKHATSLEEKHSELMDDHGQLKNDHVNSKKEARQAAERIHELEVEQSHLKQVLASYRNKDIDSFDYKEEIMNLKVRLATAAEKAKDRDTLETQVVKLKKLNASLAQSMGTAGSPLSSSSSSNIQRNTGSTISSAEYSMNSTLNEFKKEITRLKGLLDQKTNENLKLNEEILRMKIDLKTSGNTNSISQHNNEYHALEEEFSRETLKLKLELEKERNNSKKLESELEETRTKFAQKIESMKSNTSISKHNEYDDLQEISILRQELEKERNSCKTLESELRVTRSELEQSRVERRDNSSPTTTNNRQSVLSPQISFDSDLNLSTQMSTIKALENNLRRKLEVAEMSMNEIDYEKDENMKMRKQFFMYQKVLQEVCSTYSNIIFGLRERLQITKAGVEKMKTVFAIDLQKTVSKIAQKFQIELERIAHIHSRDLQTTRINLSKAHDTEKARLEKSFKDQVTALTRRHSQEMKIQKDEFVLQTDRVMNLNINKKSDNNSVSRSPSISVYAFESVLVGVLDSLSNNNMIESTDADRIIDIARSNKDPSFMASADARVLLSEILFKTVKEINDTKGDLEHMKSKIRRAGLNDLIDSTSNNSPFVSPMTFETYSNSNNSNPNTEFSPNRLPLNGRSNFGDLNLAVTPTRENRSSSSHSSPNRSVNGTPSRAINWMSDIVDGF